MSAFQPQRLPNGAWQCTARSKRSGERCRGNAMKNAATCRFHGGRQSTSAIGALNSNYRSGRYAKWADKLPARYSTAYAEALRDPQLLSLAADVAGVDARLSELAQHVDAGGSWQDVRVAYDQLVSAMRDEDQAAIRAALLALRDLATGGLNSDRAWREIVKLTERRRRLVQSERRRLLDERLYLSREQAHAFALALLDSVVRHCSDRDTLERIATDIHALAAAGSRDDDAVH
jgi:hypothetical protein